MHTRTYIHSYMHTFIHTYTYTHIHICIHIYTYTYTYTHMHTHIHYLLQIRTSRRKMVILTIWSGAIIVDPPCEETVRVRVRVRVRGRVNSTWAERRG